MAMGESSESSIPAEQPDGADTELNPETTEESPGVTPKKKSKKRNKVKEEEREEEVTPSCQQDSSTPPGLNGTLDEANGNEAGGKKKKKKKKEKRLKEEKEIELSPMEVHGSDSSGYISDKSSKKRKHETSGDATSGFSEDPDPPKSKKKRKSHIDQFAWKKGLYSFSKIG